MLASEPPESAVLGPAIRRLFDLNPRTQRLRTSSRHEASLLKPLCSVLSLITALILGYMSSWYKELSSKLSYTCIAIFSLYLAMSVVLFGLAHLAKWQQTSKVNWKVKFPIHVATYGIIGFIMDVFLKGPKDLYLIFALFFAVIHLQFAAHALHIREKFGVVEGVITVLYTIMVHLAEDWLLRTLVLVIGATLYVSYYKMCLDEESRLPVRNFFSQGTQFPEQPSPRKRDSHSITIQNPNTVESGSMLSNMASYVSTIEDQVTRLKSDIAEAMYKAKGKAVAAVNVTGAAEASSSASNKTDVKITANEESTSENQVVPESLSKSKSKDERDLRLRKEQAKGENEQVKDGKEVPKGQKANQELEDGVYEE